MANGADAIKAREKPLHELNRGKNGATEEGKTEHERMDREAIKMAKLGQKDEHDAQDVIPGSDIFTK